MIMENENMIPAGESEDTLPIPQPEEAAAPETEEASAQEAPAEELTPAAKPEEEAEEEDEEDLPARPRIKIRGALLFCAYLFGISLCLLILLLCAMNPLKSYLSQYEDSQPKYVSDAVYDLLFSDPDWDLLYDLAGVESTAFEGKAAYVSYMEAKVAGQELTYVETAAGLSGDRRYILYCGDEKVAAFTITGDSSQFTNWSLSSVEVYFTRSESITVMKAPEYTVYVNGVALDDSYTTKFVDTLAEDHLPDGLHGYRWDQLQLDGLLVEPDIVVLDAHNTPVPVTYSEETGIYSTEIPTTVKITDEEYTLAVEAAKTQALFDIREINISKLRQVFASNSQAYTDLCDAEPFVSAYKSYEIDEDSITVGDYYRYSDELFSVHVTLKMDVTSKSKKTQTYELDTTYFFSKSNSGAYLVSASTTDDLQTTRTQVRLTYVQDDTQLATEMVYTNSKSLTPPELTVEEGYAVTGWGKLEADGSFTTVLTLNDQGSFSMVESQKLSPMTLYPIITQVEAEEE